MDKEEKLFNLGAQMHFEVMEVIRTYVMLIHNSDDFDESDFVKMMIILISFLVAGIIPERFTTEKDSAQLKHEVLRIVSLVSDSVIEVVSQSQVDSETKV